MTTSKKSSATAPNETGHVDLKLQSAIEEGQSQRHSVRYSIAGSIQPDELLDTKFDQSSKGKKHDALSVEKWQLRPSEHPIINIEANVSVKWPNPYSEEGTAGAFTNYQPSEQGFV
jgi:hypothetical protein